MFVIIRNCILSGCVVIYANFGVDLGYFDGHELLLKIFHDITVDNSNQYQ